MRKLYWTIKIISALVGLVFLANMTVPNWRDLLAEGVGSASNWISHEAPAVNNTIQKFQNQAGASPSASPAPGTLLRQTPSPIQLVLGTPKPSAAPPVELGPPPATPLSSAQQSAWSSGVCQTMIENMSWDSSLDFQTSRQDGTTNPAQSAYYATWSGHWQTVVDDMNAGPCAATPAPLTGAQCTDPEQWFQTAIGGHQADETANPQNKTWDDQWIATYQQLAALWPSAGCS